MPAAMRAYLVVNSAGLLAAMLLAPMAFATFGLLPVVAICGALLIGVGLIGLLWYEDRVEQPQAQTT